MKKRMICLLLTLACLASLLPFPASAETSEEEEEFLNITISGTQDYDEVLEAYRLINAVREANGLRTLTLDPLLTENAMQRAAELSVFYSSTRPNGYHYVSGIDIRYDIFGFKGHEIGRGHEDARSFLQDKANSSAMFLSESFTTIGIGCFYQNEAEKCWAIYYTDKTIYDQFDESGKKYVSNIPIEVLPESLNLHLDGIDSSTGIKIYEGESASFQVKADWAVIDSGYSLSIVDSSIVQLDPQTNTLAGLQGGTTSLEIQVGDAVRLSVPITVIGPPDPLHLNFGTEEPNHYFLIWQDPNADAYLFGKEANAEEWTLLCSPKAGYNMYTHYDVPVGEEWSYILRAKWVNDTYIDISNQLLLMKLAAPELSISYDAATARNKLTWEAHDGDTAYEIYRGTDADGPYPLLTSTTDTSYIDTDTEEGQTYYYRICALGKGQSRSPFSNLVSRAYSATVPQLKVTNVASSGKPKLSWDPVPGAVKYEVYRATSQTGTYSRLSTTTGTSLTNTSAEAGKLYYYYVVAVDADGNASDPSKTVSRRCDLPRPVITLSNVASSGKVKISWEKIDGAVKYEVYRSTDRENWTKLSTTTGTSLTNTSTEAGTLYYYKVKAIASNSGANSAFSTVKSRRCDLPRPSISSLTIISSTGKIKIKWGAVEGAVKYELYCSTDNKTWTKLTTTTGTTINHNSAVAGTRYYYKVRAIASNSAANSAYSQVKNGTCDLARPTLTVKLNSKDQPVLTWTKIDGAVKYEVYRSTDNKTWTKLSTTTGTKLTNSSAVSGTTYYYKVRAIASVSNANSAYSTVKSIKAG